MLSYFNSYQKQKTTINTLIAINYKYPKYQTFSSTAEGTLPLSFRLRPMYTQAEKHEALSLMQQLMWIAKFACIKSSRDCIGCISHLSFEVAEESSITPLAVTSGSAAGGFYQRAFKELKRDAQHCFRLLWMEVGDFVVDSR